MKITKENVTFMSSKTWIIFVAICVIVFGGLVFYSGRDRIDVSKVETNAFQSPTTSSGNIGDHVFGNKDAKVVLVEYGDFQCPGCGSAYPIVKSLSEKYKDQMAFVFRNFPLTSIHPNARAAAAAVETAGKMDKYWQMHDLMYESQDAWSDASGNDRVNLFAGYAQQIGLNKSTFTSTLDDQSTSINKKINFDIALGRKLNISGTPTFYLDGKRLDAAAYNGQEAFEKTIQTALKAKGVTLPTKS
jgi:protein-disulfide isomerase